MTKENDPLVEAVARAICADIWRRSGASEKLVAHQVDREWWKYKDEASEAIKAMLEWYSNPKNVPNDVAGRVYDMTDMTSLNDAAIVFSSAIQTELKRREG